MRLRQDIEISYEIKAEYTKRRGGVFSPRKGGGRTNLTSNNNNINNNINIKSETNKNINTTTNNITNKNTLKQQNNQTNTNTATATPTETRSIGKQNQSIKQNNNNNSNTNNNNNMNEQKDIPISFNSEKLKRPTTAPSQRPKSADVSQRVRRAFQKPQDQAPWNNSTTPSDRDMMTILQDNEISKYRQNAWGPSTPPKPSSPAAGPLYESDRKTLSTSYSRCRDSRTSGAILNISTHHVGYAQHTMQRIQETSNTGIHHTRWNVSTKDCDEQPRAKPNIPFDQMSSETLFNTFYSNDVLKEISSRGVIKSGSKNQSSTTTATEKTWDDVTKIYQTPKFHSPQKLVYR